MNDGLGEVQLYSGIVLSHEKERQGIPLYLLGTSWGLSGWESAMSGSDQPLFHGIRIQGTDKRQGNA